MTLVIWWLVLGPCRSFAQSLQCCRCQFVLLLSKAWMMFGKEIRYLPRKMLCNMMVQTKLDSPGTEIQRERLIDTPILEMGFAEVAVGSALAGQWPL